MPPKYGSSAEESSSKDANDDKKSKSEKKPKETKKDRKKGKKTEDADHVPLGPGHGPDDDESDDLEGLDRILQFDADGNPKKRPSSRKGSGTTKKRPATKQKSTQKDRDVIVFGASLLKHTQTIGMDFKVYADSSHGYYPVLLKGFYPSIIFQ